MSRKIRRPRRKNDRPQTFVITMDDAGNSSYCVVPPGERQLVTRYVEAHALLPYEICEWPVDRVLAAAREKAAVLSGAAKDHELLEAIMFLAHLPCDTAFQALSWFSQQQHELAPLARLALGECASMRKLRPLGTRCDARC